MLWMLVLVLLTLATWCAVLVLRAGRRRPAARSRATAGDGSEPPPGKGAGDENFPVGSWLIGAPLRPAVMAFYAVARTTDDIADHPALSPGDKIRRLDRFQAALEGRLDEPDVATAVQARRELAAAGVPVDHALRLLEAFRRDAVKGRYDDWDDLLDYCARSANPVGHFLLDLHREDRSCVAASDALCSALQVINHLQDCRQDYRALDRVYLPGDWLAAEAVALRDLDAPAAGAGLRRVLDRCLAGVDGLLVAARPLPSGLRSTRLALEAAAILRLAEVLAGELKTRDPLAERVRLSKPAMLRHGGGAVLRCLLRRVVGRVVHGRRQPA